MPLLCHSDRQMVPGACDQLVANDKLCTKMLDTFCKKQECFSSFCNHRPEQSVSGRRLLQDNSTAAPPDFTPQLSVSYTHLTVSSTAPEATATTPAGNNITLTADPVSGNVTVRSQAACPLPVQVCERSMLQRLQLCHLRGYQHPHTFWQGNSCINACAGLTGRPMDGFLGCCSVS